MTGIEAIRITNQHAYNISWIGFIITQTDLFGLDLDNCFDYQTQSLLPWAQQIVTNFHQTYIEISPSGQGVRLIGKGQLCTNNQNKSPLNKSIEAYDGSSIRYLTITGQRFGKSKIFYNYDNDKQPLLWLQKIFFTNSPTCNQQASKKKDDILTKLSNNFSQKEIEKQFLTIRKTILASKHAETFQRYRSNCLINKKSASEDDWYFCLLILRYMREADPQLLREFLLRCRNRPKLKREDYIELTIGKAIEEAKSKNLIGYDYKRFMQEGKTLHANIEKKTVKKQLILKYCNMFDIFTIRKQFYPQYKTILIKKVDY